MGIIFENITDLDLRETLDCGQAFRFAKNEDNIWRGVVNSKVLELYEDDDKVCVTTYAQFGYWCAQYPNYAENYEYIICDEPQNLVNFSEIGKNEALPKLFFRKYSIIFLASFAVSVTIFCIEAPSAISIAT